MAKILEYYVAHSTNQAYLSNEVNNLINTSGKFWQPFGGVSTSIEEYNHTLHFSQAMVRYSDLEE